MSQENICLKNNIKKNLNNVMYGSKTIRLVLLISVIFVIYVFLHSSLIEYVSGFTIDLFQSCSYVDVVTANPQTPSISTYLEFGWYKYIRLLEFLNGLIFAGNFHLDWIL